ncbi:ankyrin repeat domain-containing protein [Paenibacillus sp. CGMCC 1.18879]|uniref:ankyrin repeat domain-containing protein n=1 Tax=Paenibacillus sp. CGMCC 1.18879 TaxID=2834466 RepID=UPI002931928F|nr:ankyrin repeat domain-containing protein [Paenibacillus sp. CGMCC 1.18879]
MDKPKYYMLWITSVIVLSFILSSCGSRNNYSATGEYEITNINIYKNTPVWELALAVKSQKAKAIERIAKNNPQLYNYQEPKYGVTLLHWAIGTEKYRSAEILLKLGADPNVESTDGETPLFTASGYSWVDVRAKKDAKYVKLLLRYGADPNKNYIGSDDPEGETIEPGMSPLMNSISTGIEKTKALVEAGADINYKTKRGNTASIESLQSQRGLEYAYYLIVQKKANITEPYYRRETIGNEDPNEKFFAVNLLRNWLFDLNSKEYKMKMEIVEEFSRQGVDYRITEISKDKMDQIMKLYPDTWEEYSNKY